MALPKTILHLIDTGGPGGAETIFLNLVTGLDPKRWRSVAVVPVKDWLWNELLEHGITPVHLPSTGSFDLQYLRGIARLARQHRADVIQTHLFSSAVYASAAARLLRLPVVATFHGQTDVGGEEAFFSTKMRILRRRRNAYVFVSQKLMQNYLRLGLIDEGRARVIYNGIDCAVFKPARDDAVRRALGAGADDVLIGAVGNLRQPKDYPTFVRAAAQLAQQSARYRFVIVGADDEPLRSELLGMIDELQLSDRFLLAGFRSDIARVMNALDVYVLSSSSEGFSLTTVQAMSAGVAPVVTRCGGPEEIVEHEVTGMLVPARDPGALAAGVQRLADDDGLRAAMGARARAHVLATFARERMIAGYADVYEGCVGSRPKVHAEG